MFKSTTSSVADRDLKQPQTVEGVRTFALTVAPLNALGWLGRWLAPALSKAPSDAIWLGLVQLGLPVAVYAWTRRSQVGADSVKYAGAGLFVALAATSAYAEVVGLDVGAVATEPSWVCVLLLLYALLVPGSLRHHAVLIAISALYLGAAAVAAHAFGLYPGSSTTAVVASAVARSVPTWLCGFVALLVVVRNRQADARYERAVKELEQIGSYTLQAKLGEGGMGEVWRADHAFLARSAAIKIIRPEVLTGLTKGDQAARARARLALGRFEREAKATAQLTSAHTIRVFDFGRGRNDTFFYVMELLEGLDLHKLVLRYGALPQERVRHVLLQACDSLAEAHDRGIVHRDIKPANLFLCRQGKTLDHVKVLDFGLARSDPDAKPDDVVTLPRLTRQGIVSGSPSFMSPEQAVGRDDLDRRSDIYALGCVAYFLLTGAEVFRDNNPMVVLMQQVNARPPPMYDHNPDLTLEPTFDALIGSMLAKRRDDRPATADELAGHLRAMELPVPWTQTAAQKWWSGVEAPTAASAPAAGRRFVRKIA